MKKNLFLIISEDKKIVDFNLYKILNNIEYLDDNKINYDMGSCSVSDVIDEASIISLFSSVKVIIGTNFDASKVSDNEIEYLSKYLNNYNKDVYIIFIANKMDSRTKVSKLLKDNFTVIEEAKIDNTNFNNYVADIVKKRGYKMDFANIQFFISRVGMDINNINSELEKLFIYKSDDLKITSDDIKLLIIDNIDSIMYEFTNAILDNDLNKTIKMYRDFMLEGISIDYIIGSIAGSFRDALIIKRLSNKSMSNYEISKFIGKKEFYVKKSLERLYNYTEDDLISYINKLAMIDRNLKNGIDNIDKLELFLIDKDME